MEKRLVVLSEVRNFVAVILTITDYDRLRVYFGAMPEVSFHEVGWEWVEGMSVDIAELDEGGAGECI